MIYLFVAEPLESTVSVRPSSVGTSTSAGKRKTKAGKLIGVIIAFTYLMCIN